MTWFELLKKYRMRAGYSQEELAEKSGMSRNGISDLERGRRTQPRRDSLLLLAQALGLDELQTRELVTAAGEGRTGLPLEPKALPEQSGLVGRQAELELARELLASRQSGCLWISGEPGIGKSRLSREITALAQAQGWQTQGGASHRWSASLPFAPVIDPIERYRKALPASEQAVFSNSYPVLAKALVLGPGPADNPDRAVLFTQIAAFFEDLGENGGLLLWLDDLQWAGDDAVQLVSFLSRRASRTPLILLLCFRSTELQANTPLERLLYDSLPGSRRFHRELPPLTWSEALSILNASGPGASFSQEQARVVFERSQGNPYILECYAETLGKVPFPSAPESLKAFLLGLLTDVPGPGRVLLEFLAVSDHPLPVRLLARLLSGSSDQESPLACLDVLMRRRILREEEPGLYAFVHDMMRSVVESTLSSAKRQLVCHRLAEAVEESEGPSRSDWLADLYDRAQDHPRAARYALKSGRESLAQAGYHKAAYSLYRARDLGRRAELTEIVLQASLALVPALLYQGAYERARETASSLLSQRERLSDAETTRLVIHTMQSYYRQASSREALDWAESWTAEVLRQAPSVDTVQFFVQKAFLGFLEADQEAHSQALAQAEAARAFLQDRQADLLVLEAQTLILSTKGQFNEARRLFDGKDLSPRGLDPRLWLQVTLQQLASEFNQGQFNPPDLGRRIEGAQRLASDLQDDLLMSFAGALALSFCYEQGDWTKAVEQGEFLAVSNRHMPGMVFLPLVLVQLTVVALWRGEADQAQKWEAAYLDAPGIRTNSQLLLGAVKAEISLLSGTPLEGSFLTDIAKTAEAFSPDTDTDWHCLLGLLQVLEGRTNPGWARIEASLEKEKNRSNWQDYYLGLQYRIWARIVLYSGKPEEDAGIEADLKASLDWCRPRGQTFLWAKLTLLKGRYAILRGHRAEARNALDAVEAWSGLRSEKILRGAAQRLRLGASDDQPSPEVLPFRA